jgi:glycosyltransferase involved in cell wall biosynthesis
MRLHFVLPQLDPLYGMELAAVLLLRGLAAKGVDVSATVMSGAIPPGLDDLDVEAINVGTRITRLAEAVPHLRRRLRALPTDVEIVASGLWATVPVGAALAGSGRRFVAWEHTLLPQRARLDLRVRTLVSLVRIEYLRPRLVVAVSEGVARTVRHMLPGQVAVKIANPVPASDFVPPHQVDVGDKIRLVTVGALRPIKNYSHAISALAMLPDNFVLTLAGDGSQLTPLRTQANNLKLNGRVMFLGRVRDSRQVLSQAHVLVHPSRAETFGLSLIEAANAGVPVAALPVPAVDELIPDFVTGAMAADVTPAALAKVVRRLVLDDRPTQLEFERSWRARTGAFDPRNVSQQWVEALSR